MDFLKSAVASAISKGPPFGYNLNERVDTDDSIWALHNGVKKEDGSKCSVFVFDITANKSRLVLAKNCLRKLKTLRHPGVVKVLDTVETDTYIYIATERVTPLSWNIKRKALNTETIKWGLHNTAITLKFINEDASSIHGNIRISSIYTTESGEWKLCGLEVLSSLKDEDPIIYNCGGLLPDSGRYASPEIVRGGWDSLKKQSIHVTDSWNFGTLIYEIFNGSFSNSEQLLQAKSIPPNMVASYKRLIQANPKMRLPVSHFLEQGKRAKGFFDTPLVRCADFIENMGLKDERERDEFLENLEETKDQFPEDFFRVKILPELLKSVEYGGGGPKVFSVVLMIAEKLPDDEWESTITPCIVRLFSSPDRAIRVFLLDNLPRMIEHLSKNAVSTSIWPQLVTGFSDLAPLVREQTLKAVLVIITKLSDRQINGDLLKYLAKTQNDEQPGIRTNTTICLGKIARNLGPHTRSKVLTAAFTRSLRDPFVHARNAALMALSATADIFDDVDCATKILPALCPSLLDKEKVIRTQAYKTLDVYLQRVKTLTVSMPDTALPVINNNDQGGQSVPRMGTPQTDASWAGWAISSFTKTLTAVTGEIETQQQQPQKQVVLVPSHSSTTPSSPPAPSSLSEPGSKSTAASFLRDDFEAQVDDVDPWGDMDDEPDDEPAVSKGFSDRYESKASSRISESDVINSIVSKPKSQLPKGLAKKTAASVKSMVISQAANKRGGSLVTKTPVTLATSKPKAKKVEDDPWGNDDWGDNWK